MQQGRVVILLFASLITGGLASVPLACVFPQAAGESGYTQSGYTLRTNANIVQLVFAASDRNGHVIKTLDSSDVAVVDNGSIIRNFRSFRSTSESPLDLVILLDTSDSVAPQIPAEIAEIKSFVEDSAWGEQDRVSIMYFGGLQPHLLCERNCNGEDAEAKLDSLRATGVTPLYDALFRAAELLRDHRDPESRLAMILFSDGLDTVSIHSVSDAAMEAQDLQSAIYSISSRCADCAPGKGDAVLAYLSASTGGLSFGPGQNTTEILRSIVDDLHSGYVLTYELPQQTNGQHWVRILPTTNPELQFRSRQAYSDVRDK